MKIRKRIGCVMGLFILSLCACSQNSDIYLEEYKENTSEYQVTEAEVQLQNSAAEEPESEVSTDMAEGSLCYVYICGAVTHPGVYALPEGNRIFEVIQEAGGLTEEADDTFVNQAELITDGMMIRIYTREEAGALAEEIQEENMANQTKDGRIDINTATVTELMTLPGIGSAKANAIISYRETYGEFSSIEDLMKVPGIKEGIFQQMKEHIKVNK